MFKKIISPILKVLGISALSLVLSIFGLIICLKIYGKTILETALTNFLDIKVEFANLQIDLENYSGHITGLNISTKNEPKEVLLAIGSLYVQLNKESFIKGKEIVIEEIVIEKALVNIIRNRKGEIKILDLKAMPVDNSSKIVNSNDANKPSLARDYCQIIEKVKRVSLVDCIVTFTDEFINNNRVFIKGQKLNAEFILGSKSKDGFSLPVNLNLHLALDQYPLPEGLVSLNIEAKVYPNNINSRINLETQDIDIMLFNEYFKLYAPFYFNSGVFSSSTNFNSISKNIGALTTLVFNNLSLLIKPGMESGQFLETSINKLAPYLQSGTGGIIFDFIIGGTFSNPQFGLGPQVQTALGLATIDQINNFLRYIPRGI